jgi:cytochrome o ubiquinol oxidase subunit 1
MPLYILGFNGMTRRLNYYDNPEWTVLLWIAAFGALIVLAGIMTQFYMVYVSIRDRENNRDVTGDPWNARTLEWATSSPPPFYNFAKLPKIHDRDEHQFKKDNGTAYEIPESYAPVHMPKNTWCGAVMSAFALVMGFAMVWHIWWLAIVGFVGIFGSLIVYSFERNKDYYVQPDEIEALESAHLRHANPEGFKAKQDTNNSLKA